MKGLKKTLCVILAVVMMMGLCIVGVSADTEAAISVVITTDADGAKLSDATVSLKLYKYDSTATDKIGDEITDAAFAKDTSANDNGDKKVTYKASVTTEETKVMVQLASISDGGITYAAAAAQEADVAATVSVSFALTATGSTGDYAATSTQTGAGEFEGYIDPDIISVTLPTGGASDDLKFSIDPQGLAAEVFATDGKYQGDNTVKGVSGTVLFKTKTTADVAAVPASITAWTIGEMNSKDDGDKITLTIASETLATMTTTTLTYKTTAAEDKKADGSATVDADGWYPTAPTASDTAVAVTLAKADAESTVTVPTPASGNTITLKAYTPAIPKDSTVYANKSNALTVKNGGYSDLSISVTATVSGDKSDSGKVTIAKTNKFTDEGKSPAVYLDITDGTTTKALVSGTTGVTITSTLEAADDDLFTTSYNESTSKYAKTLDAANATELKFYVSGLASTVEGVDWDGVDGSVPSIKLVWTAKAATATSSEPTAETDAMEGNKAVTITYTLGNKTKVTGLYYYTISSGEILSTSPGNLLNVTGYTNTASGAGGTITTTAGAGTRLAVNEKGTTGLMLKFDDDAEKDYLKVTLNYK